jgi:phosphate transport system substrate-binding protein
LTLQQLDQIFSATRQGSGSRSIDTWGGVGMTGEWATKPIAIYGRNSLSGTYEFFRSTVLYNGEYKESVKQQPGSAEVVRNAADDKYAIGYSGLGYKTEGVRTVPLAAFYGAQCYNTTAEATYSGKYPVARYLYIYLNKAPDEPLDPLRAEFIKYILSKDGQTLTEEGGYFPISNEIREHELETLGISTLAN